MGKNAGRIFSRLWVKILGEFRGPFAVCNTFPRWSYITFSQEDIRDSADLLAGSPRTPSRSWQFESRTVPVHYNENGPTSVGLDNDEDDDGDDEVHYRVQ